MSNLNMPVKFCTDENGNPYSPVVYQESMFNDDASRMDPVPRKMFAKAYDPTKTYPTENLFCIQDNKYYKFTGSGTTTGTFDPTKWTETDDATELTALNSTLANVSETLIDNTAKIYYKVKNGIVRVRFVGGTVNLTSGSWSTYGSLPNGVRKPDEIEYASVTCGANGKYAGIVTISPDGTISYYCTYTWGGDATIKGIWGELVY